MSGGFYANGSRFVRWRFRLFYGSICFLNFVCYGFRLFSYAWSSRYPPDFFLNRSSFIGCANGMDFHQEAFYVYVKER